MIVSVAGCGAMSDDARPPAPTSRPSVPLAEPGVAPTDPTVTTTISAPYRADTAESGRAGDDQGNDDGSAAIGDADDCNVPDDAPWIADVDGLTVVAYQRFAAGLPEYIEPEQMFPPGSADLDVFMVVTALTKTRANTWYPGISFATVALEGVPLLEGLPCTVDLVSDELEARGITVHRIVYTDGTPADLQEADLQEADLQEPGGDASPAVPERSSGGGANGPVAEFQQPVNLVGSRW